MENQQEDAKFMSDSLLDSELTMDRKIELLKIAKGLSLDTDPLSVGLNYEFLIRVLRVMPSSFQKYSNMTLFHSE